MANKRYEDALVMRYRKHSRTWHNACFSPAGTPILWWLGAVAGIFLLRLSCPRRQRTATSVSLPWHLLPPSQPHNLIGIGFPGTESQSIGSARQSWCKKRVMVQGKRMSPTWKDERVQNARRLQGVCGWRALPEPPPGLLTRGLSILSWALQDACVPDLSYCMSSSNTVLTIRFSQCAFTSTAHNRPPMLAAYMRCCTLLQMEQSCSNPHQHLLQGGAQHASVALRVVYMSINTSARYIMHCSM
eukprot:1148539-Pelagomonas_calceolata.AAC.1